MDSLRHVYSKAVIKKYGYPEGWMANWPAGFDRIPGHVGTIGDDGESFNKDGVLADYGVTANPDSDPVQPDGPWDYTSNDDITVDIGVDASLPSWEWIANAKAGLKCGFGHNGGIVLAVGSSHQEGLANLDDLRAQLVAAANDGRIKAGKAVIVQTHVADLGLLITSEGNTGDLSATTSFDAAPGGVPLLAFAADFQLHHKSESVSHDSFPDGFTIAFRVIKLGKRGWFWWRHFVVEGVAPVSDEQAEMLLTPDDYFALLPEAEFSSVDQ